MKKSEVELGMKIGVIGPESSCVKVKKSLYDIDTSLEVISYVREQVNTCDQVIEECEKECDVILFTGRAIESFVEEKYEIKKPHTSVEKSALTVAGAFLEMEKLNMELDAFSIDIVESQVIEDLLDAFHILARNIYSSSFRPGVEEQEYVDWHIGLQKSGKTKVALTSLVWVYQTLVEKGYAAIYLGPTRAMVRLALERLQNELALNEAVYSQLAVEVLQLTNYERTHENYYSSMMNKAEMEKEIIRYVESIQGAVFAYGRREYIVFSNAGVVKEKNCQQKLLKLQKKIKETGISMNVGIGTGVTANKAEMNAREALNYSLKKKQQEVYLIDNAHTIHGPLGKEMLLTYELISSDPKTQEIADKTGLSPASVRKIIAIAEIRQSYVFDAHELAQGLDVTVRSARRIMNKIMDAGLGKVYGKETVAKGGRPKVLIELLFR